MWDESKTDTDGQKQNATCETRRVEKKQGPSLLIITAASSNKHGASSTIERALRINKTRVEEGCFVTRNTPPLPPSLINEKIQWYQQVDDLRECSQKGLLSPGMHGRLVMRGNMKRRGVQIRLSLGCTLCFLFWSGSLVMPTERAEVVAACLNLGGFFTNNGNPQRDLSQMSSDAP